jgi:hypothetical protein
MMAHKAQQDLEHKVLPAHKALQVITEPKVLLDQAHRAQQVQMAHKEPWVKMEHKEPMD